MADIERTTAVENDLNAYEGFFDEDWGKDFMRILKGSKLQEIGYDLARNWHAASSARSLPHLMIKCMDALQHKNLEEIEPLGNKKISVFRDKVVSSMEGKGEKMRPMFRKKLQDTLNELDQHATSMLRSAKNQSHDKMEDHWGYLVNNQHFHSCLWSSERTCYGSIYYSYEWFLKECVRVFKGESTYRVGRDFKKDFNDAFGQQMTETCWTDQEVNIARLTRSALVHNGGRVTKDLRKHKHPFHLEGEELQIGASVTTSLYQLLAGKAESLAEFAVQLREFKGSP